MKKRILYSVMLIICVFAMIVLPGCRFNISVGDSGYITGEEYPDPDKYKTGAFEYYADEITAVEVYWRCGEVKIVESENAQLSVFESGSELSKDAAMHWFLDDGILRIRFCSSGAKICVSPRDKHLSLEVPKEIGLSVHTTSAKVKADSLEQKSLLISAHSGGTSIGSLAAKEVSLSSSSGFIRVDSITAENFECRASSGDVTIGSISAETIDCLTSSGGVEINSVYTKTLGVKTSSANVKLGLAQLLKGSVVTSSGNVALTLPAGGAKVSYSSAGGRLRTNLFYEQKGDLYVFGDGESELSVETASGNLEIE